MQESRVRSIMNILTSFAVPVIILSAVFSRRGITPFGTGTLLVEDMRRQYIDFYGYYQDVFHTKADFLYSDSIGLGGNAIGLLAYYLTSPFLLAFIRIPKEHFPTAVSVMMLVKTGLCGGSFGLYLTDLYQRHDTWRAVSKKTDGSGSSGLQKFSIRTAVLQMVIVSLFSSGYALSSYCIANIFNTMWIDVIAVFPILTLAHERLLEEEEKRRWSLLYTFCVTIILLLNYYIAYMALLFTAVRTLLHGRSLKGMFRCLLATIEGAALSMFLMLPAYSSIAGSAKDTEIMEDPSKGITLMPWQFFHKLLPKAYDAGDIFNGLPNIYCGVLLTVLFIGFVFAADIQFREKAETLILTAALILSLCSQTLNRIWHAGMLPSGYLYRNSFLLVFTILRASALFAFPGCLAFSGRPQRHIHIRNWAAAAAVLLLAAGQAAELGMNADHILAVLQLASHPSTEEFAQQIRFRTDLQNAVGDGNEGNFRMEYTEPFSENDSLMYGYRGITHYSSVQQTAERVFLRKLGFNDTGLLAEYTGTNTHAADALLGLRYAVWPNHIEDTGNVLPMAYLVPGPVSEEKSEQNTDPFRYMEGQLLKACGAAGDDRDKEAEELFFISPDMEAVDENSYRITMRSAGNLYLFIQGTEQDPQDIIILVNEEQKGEFGNSSCRDVQLLGRYEKGEELLVKLDNLTETIAPERILFRTENTEAEDEAILKVREKEVIPEIISSSRLRFTVSASQEIPENSGLALLMPYDSSWRAAVNGQKTEPVRFPDEFMYIPLPRRQAGENITVEMQYVPAGIVPGILISAAALLLIIWQEITGNAEKKRIRHHLQHDLPDDRNHNI